MSCSLIWSCCKYDFAYVCSLWFRVLTMARPGHDQSETCEYEPRVNLALRSQNKVEVSIKHCVSGVRVLCLSLSLFFYFYLFSFLHFLETGKVTPPPPPLALDPQTGMPAFWQTDGFFIGRSLARYRLRIPWGKSAVTAAVCSSYF